MGRDEAWGESTDRIWELWWAKQGFWPSLGSEKPAKAFKQECDNITVVFLNDCFGKVDFFFVKQSIGDIKLWHDKETNKISLEISRKPTIFRGQIASISFLFFSLSLWQAYALVVCSLSPILT